MIGMFIRYFVRFDILNIFLFPWIGSKWGVLLYFFLAPWIGIISGIQMMSFTETFRLEAGVIGGIYQMRGEGNREGSHVGHPRVPIYPSDGAYHLAASHTPNRLRAIDFVAYNCWEKIHWNVQLTRLTINFFTVFDTIHCVSKILLII